MINWAVRSAVRWATAACIAATSWTTLMAQEQGCIEVEAILVNSCNNLEEGLNEMVFMRVGNQPIDFSDAYLNQLPIIGFPNNNDFLTPPTPYTTNIVNQWNAGLLHPTCAYIIEVSAQLNPPYTVPAGARLILITSALFSSNSHDFSGLMDTVYVMYAGNTSGTGRFSNTATTVRRFSFNPNTSCRDTVVYLPSNLENIDGATVGFDWAGNPTYHSPGCVPPIPPTIPNPVSALVNACEGTATLRGANVSPYTGQWFVESVPPGAQEPVFFPHPDSARVTISVSTPGTYRFGRRLVSSENCCLCSLSIAYLEIDFLQLPSAEWNPFVQSICPNQTVTLSPALPGEVEWFLNGQSLGIAPEWVTDQPGTYTFVQTINGCTAQSEPRILTVGAMPLPPVIAMSPSAPCPGESIVFSANETVEWFFNQTPLGTGTEWTVVLGSETAGIYFARVSNECGYADSDVIVIDANQLPSAEWNPFVQSICPNQTVTLSPALPGEVEWFLNGQSLGIAPEWPANVPGTYTFVRTINGCTAQSEPRILTVGAMPLPPVIAMSPSAPCPGESIVFSANETVEWFFNQTPLGTGTEWTVVLGSETAGIYFARVSNECGYADSDVIVTYLPVSLPVVGINANLQNFCSTGGVLSVVNYVPGFTYRWFGPTNFSDPAAPTQIVNAFGQYGFWISNGCDSTEYRVTVSENDLPALTVSVTPTQAEICPSDSGVELVVSAAGAFNPVQYLWERDGTVVGTDARLTATSGGVYRVSVSDACGRRGSAEARVFSRNGVTVAPGRNLRICSGQTATVQLSGGENYQWTAAPSLRITDGGSLATLSPVSDQTYTCICTYGACAETLTVEVLVIPPPSLSLESERAEIEAGEEVGLRARGNAVEYRWAPAHALSDTVGERVYARPASTTVFTVTAVNALGCETNDTLVVRVKPRAQHQAGVPNVFTPNGDGVNDVFPLHLPDGYDKMNIVFYNRWGQKVISAAWDKSMGTRWEWKGINQNGNDCPEGVYVFSIEYTGRAGSLFRTGSVTLIR